jgi:penicillin amidase
MIVFSQRRHSTLDGARVDPELAEGSRSAESYAVVLSLFLIVLVAACGPPDERNPLAPTLPQVSGTLTVGGLSAPVRVIRDRWGVPHIKAGNQDDLFFAQGFVQAQDRLFQMDLWRRSVQGRLSEVLGANFIERDAQTRRIQYRGDLEAEWASYGDETKAIVSAFIRGINAWIRLAHDPFPEEFLLAGWAPEWWRPEDLLNRTDAFVASGDAQEEVFRARLVAAMGVARASSLLAHGRGALIMSRGLDMRSVSPAVGDVLRRIGTAPFFLGLAAPVRDETTASAKATAVRRSFTRRRKADTTYGTDQTSVGSNAWAVARSDTGGPLVAGDPHRPLENPALRYLVHLEAPGWHVIGATAPWLPGVAIGHNDRVAWTMTAARTDTQDIYVERLNPANPRQVLDGDRWVDVAIEKDTVAVKGRAEPLEYERLYTAHGVVVAVDRERHLAYTVRWAGAEPGGAPELGALALNRARSASEFSAALRHWKMPSAEFVFADVDGHVGRQLAARIPARSGWNGLLPVPGDGRGYEWNGWARSELLPHELDPASGLVASANDSRARMSRIADALSTAGTHSIDGFKRLQHDVLAWPAQQLVPLLARMRSERADVDDARQRLLRWDRRLTAESVEAALYIRWEEALVRALASRRVPSELVDEFVIRAAGALVPAIVTPSRVWFDADVVGQRDALLLASLQEAVDRAGAPREVTFSHPLAITEPGRRRLNIGPFPASGYAETIFANAVTAGRSVGPSFRVIMDGGDWDRSVATSAPGQSGSPGSPHFGDLAKLWAAGEYFPLSFGETAVQTNAEATLTLVPR